MGALNRVACLHEAGAEHRNALVVNLASFAKPGQNKTDLMPFATHSRFIDSV